MIGAGRTLSVRLKVGGVLGALALVALVPTPAIAYQRPGTTERVSVATGGGQVTNDSSLPSISADGRYVAFRSPATDLVAGDTTNDMDVFVRDLVGGTTELVSLTTGVSQGSHQPSISADGRYVAFMSNDAGLVPGDTNNLEDVFVRDRVAGTTERVSVASGGAQGGGKSNNPSISADGRYVAFESGASSLVAGDTNFGVDVFVRDLVGGTTQIVSVATTGSQGSEASGNASISADGRYVTYETFAPELVPGDTNGAADVFVRDLVAGTTERVSVATGGAQGTGHSSAPSISADGRYVAFHSTAPDLVPGDTNYTHTALDVFVRDRMEGTTERASVSTGGAQGSNGGPLGTGGSQNPSISADGRYVAFHSTAPDLVAGDTNNANDMFVRDLVGGITERVSVSTTGAQVTEPLIPYAPLPTPSISADGRYVAFESVAPDLVPGDTNARKDVFVRERGPSLGVLGDLSLLKSPGRVGVFGRATLSGKVVSAASDPGGDATAAGPALGAELTRAEIVYRPEEEDLLLRLQVGNLPPVVAGLPGVLYGVNLDVAGTTYEVRALRAATTSNTPAPASSFSLFRCAPSCTEVRTLQGGIGTTGHHMLVSLPLTAIEASEQTTLSDLRAFTALGEAAPGALQEIDHVDLPQTAIPGARLELGIAPRATPQSGVSFTTPADLLNGQFSGSVSTTGLPSGDYRVWVRTCLGDTCDGAISGEVRL